MALSLKAWRLARELTKDEVAKRLGKHPNTISNWESDPTSIPVLMYKELLSLYEISDEDVLFLPKDAT